MFNRIWSGTSIRCSQCKCVLMYRFGFGFDSVLLYVHANAMDYFSSSCIEIESEYILTKSNYWVWPICFTLLWICSTASFRCAFYFQLTSVYQTEWTTITITIIVIIIINDSFKICLYYRYGAIWFFSLWSMHCTVIIVNVRS